ncbi:DUF5996 family protein [uncultured Microbulbifer sp.]|uniref:DUF5996 family protein n=1 Tax=uncultured Microbulbifer sp. TaxID=348147 RepID=UPI00262FC629|nr:DUF5996 family protein [uncultured Microbulbifer sp.]
MGLSNRSQTADWPELPFKNWSDTAATLHMWTQIVGKIRLAQTPWTNHSWHVPFYVTARGLGTSLIPYDGRAFEITFDLLDHQLVIQTTNGGQQSLALESRSVSSFYQDILKALATLGLDIQIFTTPSEVADAIPFEKDNKHHHYDREFATRFWRALVQMDRVFKEFRSRFIGKCSPVHFFWGSFDLAVTRFSGREAPPHPGGVPHLPDWVAREAYSHEVSSAGFWPGGGKFETPSFYSYAYPAPDGFSKAQVSPAEAYYSDKLGEFILSYDDVRTSESPDDRLLEFLQTTYEAAANISGWDRTALERELVPSP